MTVNFQKRKSNVGLAFAMGVLVALTVLSVVVRNFWRRYLCPYGALLGILSLIVMFTGVSSPRVPPFGAVGDV